jgi:hypothetical protein
VLTKTVGVKDAMTVSLRFILSVQFLQLLASRGLVGKFNGFAAIFSGPDVKWLIPFIAGVGHSIAQPLEPHGSGVPVLAAKFNETWAVAVPFVVLLAAIGFLGWVIGSFPQWGATAGVGETEARDDGQGDDELGA